MQRIVDTLGSQRARYLLAGGVNTLFGYVLMLGLYGLSKGRLHILILGALCNAIAISFSFMTYKLFVFRTRGNWLSEWLKSYVVYGAAAVVSTLLLWLLVDFVGVRIYLAQAVVTVIVVAVSYVGHATYTFRARNQG